MKKHILFTSLIIGASVVFSTLIYTKKQSNRTHLPQETQKIPQKLSYVVDIPAKYFDPEETFEYGDVSVLKGIKVALSPVEIETTDTASYKTKFGGLKAIPRYTTHKPGFRDNIDVDNDEKQEQTVFVPTAMNHAAGEIWIIKDGYIIFKSNEGANINMTESKSHNGFYIDEAISSGTGLAFFGGYRRTRYINENGVFRPVWYQESFDLQTTKP